MVSNHLRYNDPLDEYKGPTTNTTVDIGPKDCYDCTWNLSMRLASGISDEVESRYWGHNQGCQLSHEDESFSSDF